MMGKLASIESTISNIPKAELHVHLAGTLEPSLMFEIAERNKIKLKYATVEELKSKYRFENLPDFLEILYEGAAVLVREEDFYDVAYAYLEKAHSQNVLRAEIFFAPQSFMRRGTDFQVIINGIHWALVDAERELGISAALIMCLLRDLSLESAMEALEKAVTYKEWIIGVGLGSAELNNPPSKFQAAFDQARGEGFKVVAHAGEEGPAEYVRQAIELLKVSRIDHGIHSLDDDTLVQTLVEKRIPLTVCPLSNVQLQVVDTIEDHPLKRMMDRGILVTVNSDDPAYFGGYINENYLAVHEALNLTREDIYRLAKNSFEAAFISETQREEMLSRLDEHINRET